MGKFNAKLIADPVHGTIGISDLEVKIIGTRAFQRLRRVKQLGLASFVFPSLDYSRFSHSLGVCHITGRIFDALKQNTDTTITDDEVQLYRLAALLHDVGHYPYSHALEEAGKNYYASQLIEGDPSKNDRPAQGHNRGTRDLPRFFGHERASQQVVDTDPEINEILSAASISPPAVYAIFMRESPPPFANLISSDLDADRIDYLLRTACHSGLPYGSVDLDYLLSQMSVDANRRICLSAKALRTADHFLLSRYFDYQQVAFNKTVAGLELILQDVLGELLRRGSVDLSADWVSAGILNGDWYELDDGLIFEKIRTLAKLDEGQIAGVKARSIVDRMPPKLLGEVEFIGGRDEQTVRSFRLQKQVIRQELPNLSTRFGIDAERFRIWDQPGMELTKIGSHIPISEIIETSSRDRDRYEQAIRIVPTRESVSVPIMEVGSSLMSILGDYALYSVRLYVLLTSDQESVRDSMSKALRDKLPDVQWK